MKTLFIVTGSEKDTKFLVKQVSDKHPNIVYIDADNLLYKKIGKLLNDEYFGLTVDKDKQKFIDKLIPIVTKYKDVFYDDIVKAIANRNSTRIRLFLRISNTKYINKLKRLYKRPFYKTIILDSGNRANIGKYDIRMHTKDEAVFKKQINKFMVSKLGNFNIISSQRLIKH